LGEQARNVALSSSRTVGMRRMKFLHENPSLKPRKRLDLLVFAEWKKDVPALGAVGRNSRGFQ
jgi:hypothetical protein